MLILGINAFHSDSSACVLKDGELVAAVAEERLGKRVKHVAGFPSRAIAAVLKMAGATIREVDYVAIGNDSNANLGAKVGHVLRTLRTERGSVSRIPFRELTAARASSIF